MQFTTLALASLAALTSAAPTPKRSLIDNTLSSTTNLATGTVTGLTGLKPRALVDDVVADVPPTINGIANSVVDTNNLASNVDSLAAPITGPVGSVTGLKPRALVDDVAADALPTVHGISSSLVSSEIAKTQERSDVSSELADVENPTAPLPSTATELSSRALVDDVVADAVPTVDGLTGSLVDGGVKKERALVDDVVADVDPTVNGVAGSFVEGKVLPVREIVGGAVEGVAAPVAGVVDGVLDVEVGVGASVDFK